MRSFGLLIFFAGMLPLAFMTPYVGALLYMWLSISNIHRESWGVAATAPLAQIVAIVTVIAWILSKEPKRLPRDPISWLIIALMAVVSLSTLVSWVPDLSYVKWDRIMKSLGFTVVLIMLTTSRARVHALVWILAISLGYWAIKGGAFTIMTGGNYRVHGPDNSLIADNNHLGLAILTTIPLFNYLRVHSTSRLIRIGCVAVMALSIAAVLSTYSRGAFLALVAMLVFLNMQSRHKIVMSLFLVAGAAVAYNFLPEQWFARMDSIGDYEQDASATERLGIWKVAWAFALARPLVGGGLLSTQVQAVVNAHAPDLVGHARAVHSIYFEVIGETGLVAFAIWTAIFALTWLNCSSIKKHAASNPEWEWAHFLARMLQTALVGYFVGGAFLSLGYWDYPFALAAVAVCLRRIMESESVRASQIIRAAAVADELTGPPSPRMTERHPSLRYGKS